MEETEDITLFSFQDRWEELVNKAIGDFSTLTADEKIWFTVQALIQDIDNGGYISHYYNYGADYNKETIESLEILGFNDVADCLKEINDLFPNSQPSLDIKERNEQMSEWQGDQYDDLDEVLEKMDNQFYNIQQELEETLVDWITEKIIVQ